jgi:transposase
MHEANPADCPRCPIPSSSPKELPMTTAPPAYQLFVGVDIAARTAAVAWCPPAGAPTPAQQIAQTPAGYAALQEWLHATAVPPAATLVVLEATSTYWVRLASALHAAGYAVSVINPQRAHHFARLQGRRAKTDALDAQGLAQFARQYPPPPWTPPPAIYHELEQRLAHRDSLIQLRGQVWNQHHALQHEAQVVAAVVAAQDALLAHLDGCIAAVDRELQEVVTVDPTWAASVARLRRVPGVGPVTALWLVVGTLNFTRCPDVRALTAYVGLAPQPHQSGTSIHKRSQLGHSGQGRLRQALYMATLSAARYNPVIKPYYERLCAAGKPNKVARCAAARKLLHLTYALVTQGRDFDPHYGQSAPSACP